MVGKDGRALHIVLAMLCTLLLVFESAPAQSRPPSSMSASLPLQEQKQKLPRMVPVDSTRRIRVVNTVPDFLRFWAAAQSKDEATRIKMFRRNVIGLHPELFAQNVVDLGQDKGTAEVDQRIAAYLKAVVPLIPAIESLNDHLRHDLDTYTETLAAVFPDYHPDSPLYLMVSLGSFDGAVREVDGHPALLFGVDVIAALYAPNAKLSVLFVHELFHRYHDDLDLPSDNDDGELWHSVWEEGLATYVSWRANPSANENDVLLNQTLAVRAGPLLPTLAAQMLANIRSKDPKEYAKFFLGNSTSVDIPARSGYFVGFQVASRIGINHTLPELARMHGPELEKQIEETLGNLSGDCSK